MNKRLAAAAMASVMALIMAACGSGSTTSSSGASSASEAVAASSAAGSAASGQTYKISLIVKLTDEHFSKVMAGAKAYADEHPGITVDIQSPSSATAYDEQNNMIETALSNTEYDAYCISPLQSDSVANLVSGTTKPVIAVDTDFDAKEKVAFVGTGNEAAAKDGGKTAVEEAIAQGADKADITGIILTGVQGDETHDARMRGYKAGIEEAGGSVSDVQYCDAAADKAATAMESMMQKYPDGIDVVCCTNDDMCMAAARIVKESGNEAFKNTIFCGFDGTNASVRAIKNGDISMDVAQMGYDMGYKSVEAAVNALEGKEVESFIDSGSESITKDNLDEYISYLKKIGSYEE
jgi:ribose transport system substrate-binding protein